MTTVSAEELALLISENFTRSITPPTPTDVSAFITAGFHLVPRRSSVSANLDDGMITIDGKERFIPNYMARERILESMSTELTMLEATRDLAHHRAAVEIEKLATLLHSVSDASLADCREQAKEMFDNGARFYVQDGAEKTG